MTKNHLVMQILLNICLVSRLESKLFKIKWDIFCLKLVSTMNLCQSHFIDET